MTLAENIRDNLPNSYKQASNGDFTDELVAFTDAIANAIIPIWNNYVNGLIVLPLPTIGGAGGSAPADLFGVTALLSPGMMTQTLPFTGIAAEYSSPFDEYTTHTRAVITVLDACLPTVIMGFTASYMYMPLQMDATSGWLPGAPPIPGPYVLGPVLANQTLSGGLSIMFPAAQMMSTMIKNLMIAFLGPPFKITEWMGQGSELTNMLHAIADGFSSQWYDEYMPTAVFTGGIPIGTCLPGGAVVGTTSGIRISYNAT